MVYPPPGYEPPDYGPPGDQPPDGYGPGGYGPPSYQPPGYGSIPEYGGPGYGGPAYGATGYEAPPSWYPRPTAPQPGCVPLRPLTVGDILDGAVRVIRRNPRTMLGTSAVAALVQVTITTSFEFALYDQIQARTDSASGSGVSAGTSVSELTSIFSILVVGALIGAILTGMLTLVVTQDVLGHRLSLADTWSRVRGRIWPLLGLSVVTTVLEALGLLPCLVLGIWLWGIWAVSVPALMVESTSVRGALGRSRMLVRGSFWRVWGIRALGTLVATVISSIATVLFGLLGALLSGAGTSVFTGNTNGTPVVYLLLTAIGSVIALTVTAPLTAAVVALLYVDLRMRREGLDLVLQQSAAAARPL